MCMSSIAQVASIVRLFFVALQNNFVLTQTSAHKQINRCENHDPTKKRNVIEQKAKNKGDDRDDFIGAEWKQIFHSLIIRYVTYKI